MPWPSTVHAPGVPLHVVRRSQSRAACFFGERDRLEFLRTLLIYAAQFECAVHAYVLMGNHVHLLLTSSAASGTAGLMLAVCTRHAKFVNDGYLDSSGESMRPNALWETGFEASPVQARPHVLACMRYIELNPVRAGLVNRPDAYRWSSYQSNALGCTDELVTPHPLYFALGRSPDERQAAYRRRFERKRKEAAYRR